MTQPDQPMRPSPRDRDRALTLRRRLTTSFAVGGVTAVAALGLLAETTHAGTSGGSSAVSSSSSSSSAGSSSSSESSGSSGSLSSGAVSSGARAARWC